MLRDFLNESRQILDDIETLSSYTDGVGYLGSQKNSSILSKEEEESTNNRIDVLNDRFRGLSRKIKERIDTLLNETVFLEKNSNDKFYCETRRIHLHAQSKKLTRAINRHKETQIKRREDEMDKFILQYNIAKPDATEKEIREFIKDDDGTKVASAYALGAHSAQGILEEAENRKRNIKKIEEMVKEIVDLLNLINQEVSKRTETIDIINDELIAAEENMVAANADLESALEYRIRATKIKRLLAYGALTIIFVLVFYLLIQSGIIGKVSGATRN